MKREKYVDESWKEQAAADKEKFTDPSAPQAAHDEVPAAGSPSAETKGRRPQQKRAAQERSGQAEEEMNFLNYVTSLGFQALIFLGEIPSPVTNATERNLDQAKLLIDTLTMLQKKTTGNLTEQESQLLENSIYELQMRYVQAVQQQASPEGQKPHD